MWEDKRDNIMLVLGLLVGLTGLLCWRCLLVEKKLWTDCWLPFIDFGSSDLLIYVYSGLGMLSSDWELLMSCHVMWHVSFDFGCHGDQRRVDMFHHLMSSVPCLLLNNSHTHTWTLNLSSFMYI